MDVVTGAMATLLPKLGDLLAEEYQLQASVRDDVAFLQSELQSMEAALLRLAEAPIDRPPDTQDKLWAREVRELSYDVEDCVEAFLLRIDHHAPPKNGGGLQGLRGFIDRGISLLKRDKICRDMGADVRSIKRRIVEVGERRVRYKVDGVAAKPDGPTADSLRLSALHREAAELVGTAERSDELVKMLMAQEGDEASKRRMKVVSVVGFGGLGKTTLAKIVFERLKGQFDCTAFVTISLNPNMEKVFRNMLWLPPGIVAQLDARRRAFLWTGDSSASGAQCLVAWDKACLAKEEGGLGIKQLRVQNSCLLLKLLHRLHHPTGSAWATWATKHLDIATLEGDLVGQHWEALRDLLPAYRAITRVHLGDGCSTDFWNDIWMGSTSLAESFPALFSHVRNPAASVRDTLLTGVLASLPPRLSRQAGDELPQ